MVSVFVGLCLHGVCAWWWCGDTVVGISYGAVCSPRAGLLQHHRHLADAFTGLFAPLQERRRSPVAPMVTLKPGVFYSEGGRAVAPGSGSGSGAGASDGDDREGVHHQNGRDVFSFFCDRVAIAGQMDLVQLSEVKVE